MTTFGLSLIDLEMAGKWPNHALAETIGEGALVSRLESSPYRPLPSPPPLRCHPGLEPGSIGGRGVLALPAMDPGSRPG